MHSVLVVAIVFGGIVLALAIIGSTILMAIKILRGGFSRKGQKLDADDITNGGARGGPGDHHPGFQGKGQ